MRFDDPLQFVSGDLQDIAFSGGLHTGMPFLVEKETEFSETIPLPEVTNPYLASFQTLFVDSHLSMADDHERISCLTFPTDKGIFGKGFRLDAIKHRTEFLFAQI